MWNNDITVFLTQEFKRLGYEKHLGDLSISEINQLSENIIKHIEDRKKFDDDNEPPF